MKVTRVFILVLLALPINLTACGRQSSEKPVNVELGTAGVEDQEQPTTGNDPTGNPTTPPVGSIPVQSPTNCQIQGCTAPSAGGFVLRIGETVVVDRDVRNLKIKLKEITDPQPIQCIQAPCEQPRDQRPKVILSVQRPGGCGPRSPRHCVGIPATWQEITLSRRRNSFISQGLEFKLIDFSKRRATILVTPLN